MYPYAYERRPFHFNVCNVIFKKKVRVFHKKDFPML